MKQWICLIVNVLLIIFTCSCSDGKAARYSISPANHWSIPISAEHLSGTMRYKGGKSAMPFYSITSGPILYWGLSQQSMGTSNKGVIIYKVDLSGNFSPYVVTDNDELTEFYSVDNFSVSDKGEIFIIPSYGKYDIIKVGKGSKLLRGRKLPISKDELRKQLTLKYPPAEYEIYIGTGQLAVDSDNNCAVELVASIERRQESGHYKIIYKKTFRFSLDSELLGEIPALLYDQNGFYQQIDVETGEEVNKINTIYPTDLSEREYQFNIITQDGRNKINIWRGKKAIWCRINKEVYLFKKIDRETYSLEKYNYKGQRMKEVIIDNINAPQFWQYPEILPRISPEGYLYKIGADKEKLKAWVDIWQIKIPE